LGSIIEVSIIDGMNERIVGRYDNKVKGPLLIAIGGIHGNEPAGIEAIKEVLRLLNEEPASNPGFQYSGAFIGIRGNLEAIRSQKRFINRDLNRMLTVEDTQRIRNTPHEHHTIEDKEIIELIEAIEKEIDDYQPDLTLVLDFHTTTADGGIFTICANDAKSRELALGLHAPVILGLSEGLIGTTIEYFNQPELNRFCIVFEAGQHSDPECVNRSVAAIINCMRHIGAVHPYDVDHRHDGLLISQSKGLPKMTRLLYHYKLYPGENFVMKPGYRNFQKITKGEPLASNESGIIYSPFDGLILMPKYQQQGEDGFFIVEPIEK
jgi:succinylglutamate desuccinylase